MNILSLVALLLPLVASQCPRAVDIDISPCKCTEVDGLRRLSCWGNISLPQLTAILRESMCGRSIDKFELLGFNITYLPSNLFSKLILNEIVIYSGHISRFTHGGRSAFYGLEDTLKSLSMRRCHLADDLQWQMLGELHSLSYLDLAYNELTRIPSEWADRPPPNLRSLILKGNKISILYHGSLEYMSTLVELDLSENRISVFERGALPRFANSLVILRLSYNNLKEMPSDSFHEMYGLKRVYLDNNKMLCVEEGSWLPVWGDLEVLDLNDNDLRCGSCMEWIHEFQPPVRLYGQCTLRNMAGEVTETVALEDL